ncbi:MAG: phosphate ABC transporter permease subunit PstC [Bacteroidales bacterium]|jgi:phosphate transport system permease protein|nr:phosphate ABC transporter permease subunit PstC [Bacteroidales bacterium]
MLLKRILADKANGLWMITSLVTILALPLVIGTGLYLKASPLFDQQSFFSLVFSADWAPSEGRFGFRPYITGSLYVTLLSFLFTLPVCLLSAIYLTQFSSQWLIRTMHPVIDVLAGLPSVIYGVWGVLIVVPLVAGNIAPAFGTSSAGYSILSGGIVLAIMCIPYILNMLIEVFRTVPAGLIEASLSMGATRWESVKHVVIRGNYPGIISAYGLGIAKAFGETIAVMMVVGNVVKVSGNPFDAAYPLPALIANNYGEMLSIPMYDSALMFAAFLLLIIILIFNMIFRYLIHKTRKQ